MSGHGSEGYNRALLKQPSPYPLTPDLRSFRHLTSICEARTTILARDQVARHRPALLALSAHRRDWIRSPDVWEPPLGDPRQQIASLIRHLLAVYDVPRFFDAAWTEGLTPDGVKYQRWFKHVATGRNPRTLNDLPIPMTKRMAHHFLKAPDDLGILAAIRLGQVISLGGHEAMARSLLATRIGTDFREHEFWTSVIRWFISHPEVSAGGSRSDHRLHPRPEIRRLGPQPRHPAHRAAPPGPSWSPPSRT